MRTTLLLTTLNVLLALPASATSQPAPAPAPGVAAQPAGTPPVPIEIAVPLREGDVRVKGRGGAAKQVMVRVYSGWSAEAVPLATLVDSKKLLNAAKTLPQRLAIQCQTDAPVATVGPMAVADGAFDALLPRRLNAGECVVVADAAPNSAVPAAAAEVRSVILDLGRLRGYFSLGGAISQNRSAFSQTDTFVGFTIDGRIVGHIIDKPCSAAIVEQAALTRRTNKADAKQPIRGEECVPLADGRWESPQRALRLRNFRYQVNTFAEARVGFKLANTGAATTTGATAPATAPAQRPDELAFNADQPGYFQLGLHLPISFAGMDWRNDGQLYTFYFGPVAKFGAQSFSTPVVHDRTVSIDLTKPATDSARYAIVSQSVRDGAHPFMVYGARLGIFGYDILGTQLRHRQMANDPIGYLDITWGTSAGHRSYTVVRARNEAGTTETVTITSEERRRLMIEGRLKIPFLPALVGVDLNVRPRGGEEQPNDFRFILAFRVDAQKALGRIFGGDALTKDQ